VSYGNGAALFTVALWCVCVHVCGRRYRSDGRCRACGITVSRTNCVVSVVIVISGVSIIIGSSIINIIVSVISIIVIIISSAAAHNLFMKDSQ